jgi:N-acetylmuramoyl-L-alanine amidase
MEKIPIFISPSAQPENECKFGDTEQDHCRPIGSELLTILNRDNRFAGGLCPILTGSTNTKLNLAVQKSDEFMNANGGNIDGQSCYHVCIHTNAGGGSGCAGFYSGSGKGYNATKAVLNRLNDISPWDQNDLREWTGLFEMRTIASTVYLEVNFHDNLDQAKWIHNNIKTIAAQIYRGLCDAESISYLEAAITPVVTPLVDTNLWKKEAIQEAIKLGLLTDNSWINKFDEPIPVFAVSLMLTRLKALIDNSIDKIISDKINNILQEESIKILKKK